MKVGINDFLRKHLDPGYPGTTLEPGDIERLRQLAEKHFDACREGYAPYCLEIDFAPGDALGREVILPYVRITEENKHLLQSAYEERKEGELPFLSRWFGASDVSDERMGAAKIRLILYSHEQLVSDGDACTEDPWELITVLAMGEPESPMPPQTMIRNLIGSSTGGSGEKFDPEAYRASCKFWDEYAMVRDSFC
jgi:hypothetical protein